MPSNRLLEIYFEKLFTLLPYVACVPAVKTINIHHVMAEPNSYRIFLIVFSNGSPLLALFFFAMNYQSSQEYSAMAHQLKSLLFTYTSHVNILMPRSYNSTSENPAAPTIKHSPQRQPRLLLHHTLAT